MVARPCRGQTRSPTHYYLAIWPRINTTVHHEVLLTHVRATSGPLLKALTLRRVVAKLVGAPTAHIAHKAYPSVVGSIIFSLLLS